MNLFRKMFSKTWALTTALVFLGSAFCIRLGIWQLDRLEQRRAFNSQVESMRDAPPLDLNRAIPPDIASMEWRSAVVVGEYDFENQIVLRNQYDEGQLGYHLITPLLFDGQAIFINRGWIPADGPANPQDWRAYDETGEVKVTGRVLLGRSKPKFGGIADALPTDGSRLAAWNNLDLKMIAAQMPYPILDVYIQADSNSAASQPPIPFQPELDLTEGSHFGYALQWFAFAILLFVGYPFYLRKQER